MMGFPALILMFASFSRESSEQDIPVPELVQGLAEEAPGNPASPALENEPTPPPGYYLYNTYEINGEPWVHFKAHNPGLPDIHVPIQ